MEHTLAAKHRLNWDAKHKLNLEIVRRFVIFFSIFSVFTIFPILSITFRAEAHNSKAWKERLGARTATLWVDAQTLGDLILNARGELNVTRVERSLLQALNQDRDVEEWLVSGLNYYSSNREDTKAKVRRRDVFVLNYRASKYWNFDPTKLVIDGYSIASKDILTKKEYWESELSPGDTGIVAVAGPPLKPGQKIELRYEDARATFEVPRK